jgi:hypothetical protein
VAAAGRNCCSLAHGAAGPAVGGRARCSGCLECAKLEPPDWLLAARPLVWRRRPITMVASGLRQPAYTRLACCRRPAAADRSSLSLCAALRPYRSPSCLANAPRPPVERVERAPSAPRDDRPLPERRRPRRRPINKSAAAASGEPCIARPLRNSQPARRGWLCSLAARERASTANQARRAPLCGAGSCLCAPLERFVLATGSRSLHDDDGGGGQTSFSALLRHETSLRAAKHDLREMAASRTAAAGVCVSSLGCDEGLALLRQNRKRLLPAAPL